MADPVLANVLRAQMVLQGRSGLPQDRFVMTSAWEHNDPGAGDGVKQAVADALVEFLTVVAPSSSNAMSYYIGAQLPAGPHSVNVYDLSDPPNERVPYEHVFALPSAGGNALPSEVALCLSYYAGMNRPRRRGRMYFGPLSTTAAVLGTDSREARPNPTLLVTAYSALGRLLEYRSVVGPGGVDDPAYLGGMGFSTPSEGTWIKFGIISQVDMAFRAADHGWVDDAFDTQRRRGLIATNRYEVEPDPTAGGGWRLRE